MPWEPKDAARLDEMSHQKRSLRVTLLTDGDISASIDFDGVPVEDGDMNKATVEFCSTGNGGGRSPHTRSALRALYDAILLDNREDPSGVPPYPFNIADEMEKAELPDGPVFFYDRRFYPFSNFSAFAVHWRKRSWMTSEHAYQAAKFTNPEIIAWISHATSAHEAKQIAHKYKGEVRPDWDDIKLQVMEEICRAKLLQHEFIHKRLHETGNREIIEDSPTDSFWGWGPDRKGLNHLGKIWMKLRAEFFPNG